MRQAISRPAEGGEVAGSDLGGLGLGHAEMLTRKRSLDNVENIPPFGLDGAGVSLLDLAAAKLAQSQRKQRRTGITASSPGGHQRMASNPRRAGLGSAPQNGQAQDAPALKPPKPPGAQGARLPKRNLKPLDFSGLHRAARAGEAGAGILALPVSPAQSSPGWARSADASPAGSDAGLSTPRAQPAFAGLLASAYQRASARRSSKRALSFSGGDAGLQQTDPVLGPRCPVIGGARGMFGAGAAAARVPAAVRQAQAAFEAAVAEQRRPRAARRRSKRAVSECKYCGKQYKYQTKLTSHEQHCASRLEALLYSADEADAHTIHCVCGPRHDRPAGARDAQPMVQCDGCLAWLHMACVGADAGRLPDEYHCPRCRAASAPATPRRARAAPDVMSPESHRLAALLAAVPDDGSETEEEPMSLRLKPRAAAPASSDDTMSISDVAEVARFHRQGSARRARSPGPPPRMVQSEAGAEPAPSPRHRRHARAAQPAVLTDAPSSDFLGLPFPESIFSEKPPLPGLGDKPPLSIAPALVTQQGSIDDLSQWSLAQLSTMLGGADAGPDAAAANSSFLLGSSLADLGLGLDASAAAPPVDSEFSALLESLASADADAYALPGRALGRVAGDCVDVGHGSSSTITIMGADSSQDHVSARQDHAAARQDHVAARAPLRPPPGLPAMRGGLKRSGALSQASLAALSLPSNPPSVAGLPDLDVAQLLSWQPDGDMLEHELEGLINFDA
ncbi:hypothetical protein H4R23_004825 [Coemansia sp. Cherry 401B]|nr:hypothetical protein IWW54_005100 [Coemansia sp. RSA 2705]KAJ2719645.1 hypothetical protein H4R23_004825 [Coemansia sp. Cherry 401B]